MSRQPGTPLTPLALAVLALLDERPMHPYEMYQLLLHRREDYLVKIRPGSLYHTVTRLAEQGLAAEEGTDRAGNRPERTIYRSTEAGTAALRRRICELIRQPIREYPNFPLAISEAHTLPAETVIAMSTERIELLEQDIAEMDALHHWGANKGVPRRYWMVLEYLRGQLASEVDWLRRIVTEISDGTLPWTRFDANGTRLESPDDKHPGADWVASVSDEELARVRKGGAPPADQ